MLEAIMKNNWWNKNWKWILPMSFLISIITVFLGFKIFLVSSIKSNWVYQEAIKRVKDNKSIKKFIGEDFKESFFIQGNLNTTNISGDAHLTISISGSNGNGIVYVMASKSKGDWFFEVLEVEISGKQERVYLKKNLQVSIDKDHKCTVSQSKDLTKEDSEFLMRERIRKHFVTLLEKECFKELNQLIENYHINNDKTRSGRLKSAILYDGIYNFTYGLDPRDQESWNKLRQKVLRWTDAYPHSPAGHITYSNILQSRAWKFRGEDWAYKVKSENWEKFFQYLKKTRNYLLIQKNIGDNDPEWYTNMLDIARGESWSLNDFNALFTEATNKFPYVQDIYFDAAFYLLPEWKGSYQEVDNLANYAVQKTQDAEGFGMYTRIYWFIGHFSSSHRGRKLFNNSSVDWNKMKLGMDDILGRYPDPWNINKFAYFSCLAGDKEKTKNLLNRMEEIVPIVWEEAKPYDITLEYCRNLASD